MAHRRLEDVVSYVERDFNVDSINRGVDKFNKCLIKLSEIETTPPVYTSQKVENFEFLVRKTLLEVFGEQSYEYQHNQNYKIYLPRISLRKDMTDINQRTFISKLTDCREFLESFIENLEYKKVDIDTTSTMERNMPLNLWSLLHPKVATLAKSRFDSQNYADAVEAVFKEINSVFTKQEQAKNWMGMI